MSGEATIKLKDLNTLGNDPNSAENRAAAKLVKKKKQTLFDKLNEMGNIKTKEVVEFTRHMTVMLGSGVTIFEAISFLKDQSKNKVFAAKLGHIIEKLNNGESLSVAMKRYPKVFPEVYTNIVQVGEKSGTLSQTMNDLADHLEENERFKKKVKGALVYPKIILFVMLIFMVVLFYFVMPRIISVFVGLNADIPTPTRIVISLTEFIQNRILFIIAALPGAYILLKLIFKNKEIRRKRDMIYIKAPLLGKIALNYNTAQVAQHFGTLFESGLTIPRCLEITESVIANTVFKEEIGGMIEKIKSGASFSSSFKEESIFPPMFVKLIKVGERTGKLPHVISYMKNYYSELVDGDVKNISSIIEPLVMVLLGLMVTGLVVTIIGPIYKLISNVG